MPKRLKLKAPADLVDRDGKIIGKLHSISVEMFEPEDEDGGLKGVKESSTEELLPPTPQVDEPLEVWNHYVEVMKPRNVVLDADGRKLIREALKVATVAECKRAIDGCKASSFHMGQNDRHRKYNRLSQILKGKRGIRSTREQIDLFLDIAESSGITSGVTSADPARVSQAKRAVLDAWEFPNDPGVAERGDEAKRWLEEHGWNVDTSDGRPAFRAPGVE